MRKNFILSAMLLAASVLVSFSSCSMSSDGGDDNNLQALLLSGTATPKGSRWVFVKSESNGSSIEYEYLKLTANEEVYNIKSGSVSVSKNTKTWTDEYNSKEIQDFGTQKIITTRSGNSKFRTVTTENYINGVKDLSSSGEETTLEETPTYKKVKYKFSTEEIIAEETRTDIHEKIVRIKGSQSYSDPNRQDSISYYLKPRLDGKFIVFPVSGTAVSSSPDNMTYEIITDTPELFVVSIVVTSDPSRPESRTTYTFRKLTFTE